jgi:hypothetical protein
MGRAVVSDAALAPVGRQRVHESRGDADNQGDAMTSMKLGLDSSKRGGFGS